MPAPIRPRINDLLFTQPNNRHALALIRNGSNSSNQFRPAPQKLILPNSVPKPARKTNEEKIATSPLIIRLRVIVLQSEVKGTQCVRRWRHLFSNPGMTKKQFNLYNTHHNISIIPHVHPTESPQNLRKPPQNP